MVLPCWHKLMVSLRAHADIIDDYTYPLDNANSDCGNAFPVKIQRSARVFLIEKYASDANSNFSIFRNVLLNVQLTLNFREYCV